MTIEKDYDWHGIHFSEPLTELDSCLCAFAQYPLYKSLGWPMTRADTFWRITAIVWPKTEGAKIWVEPNPWAERMIEAACKYNLLGASGCGSSGKSFLLGAAWGLVNWMSSPCNTKVIITSQTVQGSRGRVWKDIKSLFQTAMGIGWDKYFPPAKLLDATAQIHLDPKILGRLMGGLGGLNVAGGGLEIVAGGKGEASQTVGKLQGIKADRFILIADEMPLLEQGILEAGIGNLSANRSSQIIGLGNFDSIYDPFGVFVEPVDGWKSVHENSEGWETKPLGQRGYCLRFDGEKSPNVLSGVDIYPGLYSLKFHQVHIAMGRNSPSYWKFCRAMPMPEGGDLSIYSELDLSAGDVHGPVVWDGPVTPVSFLDPAFTNGGDRSMGAFGLIGLSGDRLVLRYSEPEEYKADMTITDMPHSFQILHQWRDSCKRRGIRPECAGFDSTGAGISFGAIVHKEWNPRVQAISFGGSASDLPVSMADATTCADTYDNRVAEIWVQGREYVRSNQIKGMGKTMARELLARQFPDPKVTRVSYKKTRIETKKEMKARVGYSPDEADAGLGLMEVGRHAVGFVPHGYGGAVAQSRKEQEEAAQQADAAWDENATAEEYEPEPVGEGF